MTRARALVSAVPSRVWTAIAGLVLLASLGVTLVLGAGLATWRGGVSHAPFTDAARPPITGTTPPGSAVVVVPTPSTHRHHQGQPPTVTTVAVGPVAPATGSSAGPAPVATPPAPTVVPPVVPAVTPVTAHPRVSGPTVSAGPGKRHGKGAVDGHVHGRHGNRGKHLGWAHNKHAY